MNKKSFPDDYIGPLEYDSTQWKPNPGSLPMCGSRQYGNWMCSWTGRDTFFYHNLVTGEMTQQCPFEGSFPLPGLHWDKHV